MTSLTEAGASASGPRRQYSLNRSRSLESLLFQIERDIVPKFLIVGFLASISFSSSHYRYFETILIFYRIIVEIFEKTYELSSVLYLALLIREPLQLSGVRYTATYQLLGVRYTAKYQLRGVTYPGELYSRKQNKLDSVRYTMELELCSVSYHCGVMPPQCIFHCGVSTPGCKIHHGVNCQANKGCLSS